MGRTVELRIAGSNYRVVSSAAEADLKRLAQMVSAKLVEVTPKGRPVQPQSMFLAAIALAHEVETERAGREAIEQRTREVLQRALSRIDEALASSDDTSGDGSAVE